MPRDTAGDAHDARRRPFERTFAMAETRHRYNQADVVRRLRRQGPEGLTVAVLAQQLGAPATSVMNYLKRNERSPENPAGAFVRVNSPRSRTTRWTWVETEAEP